MRHNKNSDVFLIYNNLLRLISKSIVFENKNNKRDASVAKTLIIKYFSRPNLKEYLKAANVIKEWKLGKDEKDAASIMLQEIRDYVRENINLEQYKKDKIDFISEVKKIWNLDILLATQFDNYKSIVSTHLFLEDCLSKDKNPQRIEDRIRIKNYLVEEITKDRPILENLNEMKIILESNKVDDYLMSIMEKKFLEEVDGIEDEDQKIVIEQYVFHNDTDEYIKWLKGKLITVVNEIKENQKKSNNFNNEVYEIVNNLFESAKKINYENYVDITKKLLYAIELNKNII